MGWGGGVGAGLSLNMYFVTDRPAQTILLNPFHYTATKSPFTLLEITKGQDKIYGWSAQTVYIFIFQVLFAGYTIPHPSEDVMHLRIQTKNDYPAQETSENLA